MSRRSQQGNIGILGWVFCVVFVCLLEFLFYFLTNSLSMNICATLPHLGVCSYFSLLDVPFLEGLCQSCTFVVVVDVDVEEQGNTWCIYKYPSATDGQRITNSPLNLLLMLGRYFLQKGDISLSTLDRTYSLTPDFPGTAALIQGFKEWAGEVQAFPYGQPHGALGCNHRHSFFSCNTQIYFVKKNLHLAKNSVSQALYFISAC